MIKRVWFRPRVMRDVSTVDTSSTVFGIPVSLPLFICPTGLTKLINSEAEKGLARAARSTGILECVGCLISVVFCQQLLETHTDNSSAFVKRKSPSGGNRPTGSWLSILVSTVPQQATGEICCHSQAGQVAWYESGVRYGRCCWPRKAGV